MYDGDLSAAGTSGEGPRPLVVTPVDKNEQILDIPKY